MKTKKKNIVQKTPSTILRKIPILFGCFSKFFTSCLHLISPQQKISLYYTEKNSSFVDVFLEKSTKKWVVFALKILKWASISSKTQTAIGLKFCRNIELYYKQKELRNKISQLFYVYASGSFNLETIFSFSPLPVVLNLISGKSYFAKMPFFKIIFDKIIHKVLGIIIRNFGV